MKWALCNHKCIIGIDPDTGLTGFYNCGATAVTFRNQDEAYKFIDFLEAIGHCVNDIEVYRI